jgi:hypothetical protein
MWSMAYCFVLIEVGTLVVSSNSLQVFGTVFMAILCLVFGALGAGDRDMVSMDGYGQVKVFFFDAILSYGTPKCLPFYGLWTMGKVEKVAV